MSNPDLKLIDHLIDVARGAVEPEAEFIENRTNRRCEFNGAVAFVQWTPTGGKSISTIVRCKNICPGGMCLTSRYMLHVGHEGALLVERSNGERVILGVKVVHCRYVGDMRHESGVQFVQVPEHFSEIDFQNEQGHLPELKDQASAA